MNRETLSRNNVVPAEAMADPKLRERFFREMQRVAYKAVRAAGSRFGAGEADIEDAVGDVFVELLKNDAKVLRGFRGESAWTTWLTVVAHRVAVKEFARRCRRERIDGNRLYRAPSAPSDEEVLEHLERVRIRDRRALVLFHIEGASYQEIARELEIPTAQVGMVLRRARQSLAQILMNS